MRSEIKGEIQRLRDASESDYAAAQLRESSVKKEFDAAMAQYQQANQAQVKLRELEASAQAHQDLYNTFITRYNASLQQAASPIAEASVITPATPLIQRDYKKTYKTAALFPALGLALGLGIALLREVFDGRVFLTSRSVQSSLRIPCIGLLPRLQSRRWIGWRTRRPQSGNATRALVRGDREISWSAVDHPLSRFTEGIRSIKLAIDVENRSRSTKVIGFTSATPNEGKSTTALAVGQLIAHNGASVIVIDCDLRNPSLTRSVAPSAACGIIELAQGRKSLASVIWRDPSTQMAFLPAIPHMGPPDPPSVLSSVELKQIFDELRKQYEFVIVDLSPLAGVVDVCAHPHPRFDVQTTPGSSVPAALTCRNESIPYSLSIFDPPVQALCRDLSLAIYRCSGTALEVPTASYIPLRSCFRPSVPTFRFDAGRWDRRCGE